MLEPFLFCGRSPVEYDFSELGMPFQGDVKDDIHQSMHIVSLRFGTHFSFEVTVLLKELRATSVGLYAPRGG